MFAHSCHKFAVIALSLGIMIVTLSPMSPAAKKTKHAKTSKHSEVQQTTLEGDLANVTAQISLLQKYLAEADANKLASLWTLGGSYTDEDGIQLKGRSALEQRFASTFADNGKQLVDFIPGSVNLLSPNVALAEGVVRRNEGSGSKPQTRYSIVFVKQGNWLIESATETPFQPAANVNPLNDLSWLVGEWSAERDGKSVRLKAEWTANNKFINLKYESKHSADAPLTESREVIGWDPRVGQPVSWHFDSSGGFGHGDWSKENNRWIVKAVGVDRNGSTTVATDVLSITTPDAFSWQSVNRTVDGVAFNDSAPIKVVRITK